MGDEGVTLRGALLNVCLVCLATGLTVDRSACTGVCFCVGLGGFPNVLERRGSLKCRSKREF
jgi:hypothetical protein